MTLEDVLRTPPAARISEVVDRLRAVEAALPPEDGVACFTRLYLAVTEEVGREARPGAFADVRFVRWLDVVFANLFLAALAAHFVRRRRVPRAWAALFEARSRPGIAPIQFALAGMNAHINRDLPLALVETCRACALEPRHGSAQHADFGRVDGLLARTEARVKAEYATGLVGCADDALGRLDDVVAMWNVRAARQAAWVNAEVLWALRRQPLVAGRYVITLDRSVGLAGRGLLAPVL